MLVPSNHCNVDSNVVKIGGLFTKLLTSKLQESLRAPRIEPFKTKNKKLQNSVKLKDTLPTKYAVPIINLSSHHLNQR